MDDTFLEKLGPLLTGVASGLVVIWRVIVEIRDSLTKPYKERIAEIKEELAETKKERDEFADDLQDCRERWDGRDRRTLNQGRRKSDARS